jgi:hypothetical protein
VFESSISHSGSLQFFFSFSLSTIYGTGIVWDTTIQITKYFWDFFSVVILEASFGQSVCWEFRIFPSVYQYNTCGCPFLLTSVCSRYGEQYASEDIRKYLKKVKNAQEAHEAIRPTSIRRLPCNEPTISFVFTLLQMRVLSLKFWTTIDGSKKHNK